MPRLSLPTPPTGTGRSFQWFPLAIKKKVPALNHHLPNNHSEDEARSIRRILEESRFCKTLAAKRLGISRTTLWRKIREMGLDYQPPGA
ncbi:MAG: helix-turn-helix domain-containing protein [Thermodesulfobacteriota bacterium]|nr:helix-turn-helix domain-containing protein [Thermodesulfobacteriota bacterium]